MAKHCENCGAEIIVGALIKQDNPVLRSDAINLVNFFEDSSYEALCMECGGEKHQEYLDQINSEIASLKGGVLSDPSAFPMFTTDRLQPRAEYKLLGMVTANITVGTGIFNEFSQGFSDFFGVVNSQTGMSAKVNSGEQAARAILVHKALAMGGNCIIAIDIDYGTTVNNAATINMQGTATTISNLEEVLDQSAHNRAERFLTDFARLSLLNGWLNGKLILEENESGNQGT